MECLLDLLLDPRVVGALIVALAGAGIAVWAIGPTARANVREANAVAAYNDLLEAYGEIGSSSNRSTKELMAIKSFLVAKIRIAVFGSPEVFNAVTEIRENNHASAMVEVVRQMRIHVGRGQIDYERVSSLIGSDPRR